jgi:hypothetical protein
MTRPSTSSSPLADSRSNMSHWDHTEHIKELARRQRRNKDYLAIKKQDYDAARKCGMAPSWARIIPD